MTIAWIDLETTGLDPNKDDILEVACVVTTDDLQQVARFERVIFNHAAAVCLRTGPGLHAGRIDPYVVAMHTKNGLWRESDSSTRSCASVAAELVEFLSQHAGRLPQLGGSSVHFDRSFLAKHMPDVERALHHRHVDASVLNEMARRFWPAVHDGLPRGDAGPAHRAMADILASIETARYYRRALGPVAAGAPIDADVRSAYLIGVERAESGDIAKYTNWSDAADAFMIEYRAKSPPTTP